jgi:uncharacterized membrane protein YphA (DoxX/SURF4 family)
MTKTAIAARILMGVAFLVTGLNGFFHFLPEPELPPAARVFMGGLVASRYMMPLVMATQTVGGALLLTGVAVPLALLLLAPVLVNIVLFHLVLAPAGIVPGLVLGLCEIVLARAYWPRFRGLFG